MPNFKALKEFKIEGLPDVAVGQTVELAEELAAPLVADGTLEAIVEAPKPELTPEEKLNLRRTSMFADMMVSFRQEVEGIEMNMERLTVHKRFWQRRHSETLGDMSANKKVEDQLMGIEKQFADLRHALKETKNFMSFLDEVMSGKLTIDFSNEEPKAEAAQAAPAEEVKA